MEDPIPPFRPERSEGHDLHSGAQRSYTHLWHETFFYCLKDKTFTASAFSVNADNAYRPISDRRIAFVTGAYMDSLVEMSTIFSFENTSYKSNGVYINLLAPLAK